MMLDASPEWLVFGIEGEAFSRPLFSGKLPLGASPAWFVFFIPLIPILLARMGCDIV